MRIRWKGFELPTRVLPEESSQTNEFGRFFAEPFERGYGITVGNSLRRVLLSSLEGTAPVSLRIKGADHEFAAVKGVVEDVINICLNVKGLQVKFEGAGPELLKINKKGQGSVLAGDIECPLGVEVVNKDLVIATLSDDKTTFEAEIEIRKGRGYVRVEDAPWKANDEIGTIMLDAAFSPVKRARWRVEETRVGKMTNFDRLTLEIWTDGVIKPEDALVEASSILRKHLNPFVQYYEVGEELMQEEQGENVVDEEMPESSAGGATLDKELEEKLNQPVSMLDPSVRAANCLSAEGLKTLRDLAMASEAEMLQVRNFGKTSLKEIKSKLADMGITFGMLRNDNQPSE